MSNINENSRSSEAVQTEEGLVEVLELLCSLSQVQVQVQVWFSLQLKFNSLELDSEVERLVSNTVNLPCRYLST